MFLQKKGHGWRTHRKKGGTTFCGPIRATEAAADEDKQQLEEVAAVSMDCLKKVHARLQRGARRVLPAPSVKQHGSGWRARATIDKRRVCGPTRRFWSRDRLSPSDTAELQSAVERLYQEVAEVGAGGCRHGRGALWSKRRKTRR